MEISIRSNKYMKYKFLNECQELRSHLPDTDILTDKTLAVYLEKYDDIILKPLGGKRGLGVMRVYAANRGQYGIHSERKKKIVEGAERLYDAVNGYIGDHSYIVQWRIPLATVGDRPFDVRVIVQRKSKSHPWKVTGKAAKIAGKGYIVTNIERSKGSVLSLSAAIRKSSLKDAADAPPSGIKSKMDKVALLAAAELCKLYTEQCIFGFDMGISKDGRIWIIEANLSPMLTHFKKLDDKRMYRRILRYQNTRS